MTLSQAESLRAQVDRLRRERNEARSDAMKWLEEQQQSLQLPGPSPAISLDLSAAGGLINRSRSDRGFCSSGGLPSKAGGDAGGPGAMNPTDYKAAAAIAKLKAKVERLRKERDGAEKQAAKWLSAQQDKLRREMSLGTMTTVEGENNKQRGFDIVNSYDGVLGAAAFSPTDALVVSNNVSGIDTNGGGKVVASLKAESMSLKKELDDAKKEAQRWRHRAAAASTGSASNNSSYGNLAGAISNGIANGNGSPSHGAVDSFPAMEVKPASSSSSSNGVVHVPGGKVCTTELCLKQNKIKADDDLKK